MVGSTSVFALVQSFLPVEYSNAERLTPPTVDPPQLGRTQHRLQRRRVVPSDHLSGSAVDQDQVALVGGGPREFASDQHIATVGGHVKHFRIRSAKLRPDVLELVCRSEE